MVAFCNQGLFVFLGRQTEKEIDYFALFFRNFYDRKQRKTASSRLKMGIIHAKMRNKWWTIAKKRDFEIEFFKGNYEWFCKDKISISTDYLFRLFQLIILIRFWRISNPLQYSKLLRIFNLLKRTGARCAIILSNVNYPYSQNTENKSCKNQCFLVFFERKTQNKRVRKVFYPLY